MKYIIKNHLDQTRILNSRLELYAVKDYMGTDLYGIAIILDDVTEPNISDDQYVLTVSFGEFIGMKNCAYIDPNNCYFADQLLSQGLAIDTGLSKSNGWCHYPLWLFDEAVLIEIDRDIYQKYSDAYEGYMTVIKA